MDEEDKAEEDDVEEVMDFSIASQQFIQNNYKSMDIEKLAVATRLPPETIETYISLYEEEARSRGLDPDKHFAITISLTKEGNVGLAVQFPREEELKEAKESISRLLFAINSGALKPNMVNFFNQFAEQRKAYALINDILGRWGDLVVEKEGKKNPIIRASEVLR